MADLVAVLPGGPADQIVAVSPRFYPKARQTLCGELWIHVTGTSRAGLGPGRFVKLVFHRIVLVLKRRFRRRWSLGGVDQFAGAIKRRVAHATPFVGAPMYFGLFTECPRRDR